MAKAFVIFLVLLAVASSPWVAEAKYGLMFHSGGNSAGGYCDSPLGKDSLDCKNKAAAREKEKASEKPSVDESSEAPPAAAVKSPSSIRH